MASRHAETKVFDYCLNPVHVCDQDKDVIVPCGKCDGCRLHKANEWSYRVADEITNCPYPVAFTLTYSNTFLPVLQRFNDVSTLLHKSFYRSNHSANVRKTLRFDKEGNTCFVLKPRLDDIVVDYNFPSLCPTGLKNLDIIPYASKRDIQLFLKLLRKLIYARFPNKSAQSKCVRYFIISEYGETYYRPHYHGIFFFNDREVSSYVIEYAIYQCWPMCDKVRLSDHIQYCDSRASRYLTQYINSFSLLPQVYQKVKELRPFRLSSKKPSMGFGQFDKAVVSEKIIEGIDYYYKPIRCIGSSNVFRVPANYISAQFPKCYRYSKIPYSRLLSIYGLVFWNMSHLSNNDVRGFSTDSDARKCSDLCVRLRQVLRPQDVSASLHCYRYCLEYGCTPSFYVYILDLLYYKQAMNALKLFYEFQQDLAKKHEWLKIARMYSNFADMRNWLVSFSDNDVKFVTAYCFLESLSICAADLDEYDWYVVNDNYSFEQKRYELELSDILADMVKKPKYNTLIGNSPDIV